MKLLQSSLLLLLTTLAFTGGCAHHVQTAPSLTKTDNSTPAQQPAATQKDFFSRTADATWDVVSAPVRLMTPQKKPAAAPPEPETYQAPEAIIIVPQAEGAEGLLGVATQPATTQPK